MVKVEIRPHESPEQLLRRFRKKLAKSKIMSEVRHRRWHVSRGEQKRIKKKKAIRRIQRRQRRNNGFPYR